MKQKSIYPVWGVLYILCCALGFLTQRSKGLDVALTVIAVLFFVPGVILMVCAYQKNDKKELKRLRLISLGSLALTLTVLAVTFATARASVKLGDALQVVLGLVSVPMFCSKIWALPLFLWACLFIASFPRVIGK